MIGNILNTAPETALFIESRGVFWLSVLRWITFLINFWTVAAFFKNTAAT